MWLLGLGNMFFIALAQSWKCEEQQGGYFGRMGITLSLYQIHNQDERPFKNILLKIKWGIVAIYDASEV